MQRDWMVVVVSILTLMIVGAYTEFARRQWLESQLARSQSAHQFRSDQRPYVWLLASWKIPLPKGSGLLNYDERKNQLQWTYFYTNYGKSPAIVSLDQHLAVGPGAMQQVKWYETSQNSFVIPPGMEHFSTATLKVPKSDVLAAKVNGDQIVLFGHFSYTDLGGTPYSSEFCMSYLAIGAIRGCTEHNQIR